MRQITAALASLAVIGSIGAGIALAARPIPDISCALPAGVKPIHSFNDLPPTLRADLTGRIAGFKSFPEERALADTGEEFTATDVITNKALPSRRFIRAGQDGERWFLWYEHGGFAYHLHIITYDMANIAQAPVLFDNFTAYAEEACSTTLSMLAGRKPDRDSRLWFHF